MEPSVEAIIKDYEYQPERVQRVAVRNHKAPLTIVEPDPSWPATFALVKQRIESALPASAIVDVAHTGSTSVPGLPAKPTIDIDLTVADILDEDAYAPQLESVGFQWLLKEPHWHEHRFFYGHDPSVNLHVWGPGSPEVVRHKAFRDWLLKSADDRALYATVKREAAAASTLAGESVMQYNARKETVVREVLQRAFRDKGYIE